MPPALRRGRAQRIVRWIGAGNHKLPKPDAAASDAPEGRVIRLCWSDTFGRPVRPNAAGSAPAEVLPFRGRGKPRATRATPDCDAV